MKPEEDEEVNGYFVVLVKKTYLLYCCAGLTLARSNVMRESDAVRPKDQLSISSISNVYVCKRLKVISVSKIMKIGGFDAQRFRCIVLGRFDEQSMGEFK